MLTGFPLVPPPPPPPVQRGGKVTFCSTDTRNPSSGGGKNELRVMSQRETVMAVMDSNKNRRMEKKIYAKKKNEYL